MKFTNPKYYECQKYRNLIMSRDYYAKNKEKIDEMLDFFGFDAEFDVTIIDDEYNDVVHFMQSLNKGEEIESITVEFKGRRENSYH